jgi:hypothetical protein
MPWWDFNEARAQDGKVTPFSAGRYDDNDYFLVIKGHLKKVNPGDLTCIEPYSASDEPYISWDGLLVAAAEELKLSIVRQPGWLFMPHMA